MWSEPVLFPSRDVPGPWDAKATSAPVFAPSTAFESAWPVSASTPLAIRPAARDLSNPAAFFARPRSGPGVGLAVHASACPHALLSGPYSLIHGIKSGKPTHTRPTGRFHHRKGGSSEATRNKP